MTDLDPSCAKCGHKRSNHHYRHPFVGPSQADTIAALATDPEAVAAIVAQVMEKEL